MSSQFKLKGRGFTLEKLKSNVEGNCSTFEFNNYLYSNLDVLGLVQDKVFNGALSVVDPSLTMDFEGLVDFSDEENIYDFSASIANADLNALHFVERDSIAVFNGTVAMDMRGTNLDDVRGFLQFKNTSYSNQNDDYYFEDFHG